jgi:hypothetical protein
MMFYGEPITHYYNTTSIDIINTSGRKGRKGKNKIKHYYNRTLFIIISSYQKIINYNRFIGDAVPGPAASTPPRVGPPRVEPPSPSPTTTGEEP